jgi:Fe-S cluster biogenesis protein NfuA
MTQEAAPAPGSVPGSTPGTSPTPSGSDSGGSNHPADTFERVAAVIEMIRPAVQSDDGDLELVEVTSDGVVRIRFHGACVGCPSSAMTLKMGVERNVIERVPEIVSVEQVD